ncbi:MAG: hypothetical protein ACD_4C00034G0002 [uncultured bacterium (gcode 4)]|uniref:Uncharacterized protein n=1 Tax=uncultured bacterium (gcode 4) TaxID=1234023 RepID=K2FYY6_9BACT|nr:MAG: hypothetical protein ACD_4C00034G0002 [uncultured bacterium (gcode 4)]
MKEYSFIIWEAKYTVKDEDELSLIFDLLSWDAEISSILHWNVIMELDDALLDLIKTHKWLIKSLKFLNEKNSFLLLVKIGDRLLDIVWNSENLWEILARIPEEENKIRLLRQSRSTWLRKLISEPRDLSNILEWIYWNSEYEFLEIIWFDYIKNLFTYTKEIYYSLHYLNNQNKNILIDEIWIENILKMINTWKDLLFIIKWSTVEKSQEILNNYSRNDIKDFFKYDKDFHYFLSKLSNKKEKLFLDYLWL